MKRFLAALAAALVLLCLPVFTVCAKTGDVAVSNLAMLDIYSSAEGSMLNYFTVRPVMEYCNEEGNCKGILFDGIIFLGMKAFGSPDGAMGFVDDLCVKGVLDGAEQAGNELYENSYLGENDKYPVFVAFPFAKSFFDDADEVEEFCRYYLDTFVFAFENKGFKRVKLAGFCFGEEFSADETLFSFCAELCRDKGLATVSTDGTLSGCDICCTNILSLNGVPNDSDKSYVSRFISGAKALLSAEQNGVLAVTFDAYNTLYECGAGLEENPPNLAARLTYDGIRAVLRADLEKLTEIEGELGIAENGNEPKGKVPGKAEYAFYVFLSVLAAACFVYMIFALFRRKR